MSPDQCREARGLLRWSQGDLAAAADVPLWFVIAFEDEDSPIFLASHEVDLRDALKAAGIKFDGDDVTLTPEGRGKSN
jgi:hypothetical protein